MTARVLSAMVCASPRPARYGRRGDERTVYQHVKYLGPPYPDSSEPTTMRELQSRVNDGIALDVFRHPYAYAASQGMDTGAIALATDSNVSAAWSLGRIRDRLPRQRPSRLRASRNLRTAGSRKPIRPLAVKTRSSLNAIVTTGNRSDRKVRADRSNRYTRSGRAS
jgi:hypothetical protein